MNEGCYWSLNEGFYSSLFYKVKKSYEILLYICLLFWDIICANVNHHCVYYLICFQYSTDLSSYFTDTGTRKTLSCGGVCFYMPDNRGEVDILWSSGETWTSCRRVWPQGKWEKQLYGEQRGELPPWSQLLHGYIIAGIGGCWGDRLPVSWRLLCGSSQWRKLLITQVGVLIGQADILSQRRMRG